MNHFMYTHLYRQMKHSCYVKMPRLTQTSKTENHFITSEFLLSCRQLGITLSQYLCMMLFFHDRRSFLKIYSKYRFSKLFLMDLHLKEQ